MLMLEFVSGFNSVVIASLDEGGCPFNSYAPFVFDGQYYYVFISDIARHAQNLRRDGRASLLFIEDENGAENLFARQRVCLQCDVDVVERTSTDFDSLMERFKEKFDAQMIGMLLRMRDFNLYRFRPIGGEATFGFGEAYTLGGEHMQTLIPRSGGGHQKK